MFSEVQVSFDVLSTVAPSIRGLPLALGDAAGRAAYVIVIVAFAFFAVVFEFRKIHEQYASGDSATPDRKTNCPSCGARIPVETDACEYCENPVDR